MFLATSSASILVSYHQSKNVGQQQRPCSSAVETIKYFLLTFYVFSGCTKAFSQLSNLQSHSRCHQTDKPHKCQSCYKCFADEAALLEHIPKHKESKHVKTHICAYCGKSYTQVSFAREAPVPPSKGLSLGEREIPEIIFSFNYLQINSRNQAKT